MSEYHNDEIEIRFEHAYLILISAFTGGGRISLFFGNII